MVSAGSAFLLDEGFFSVNFRSIAAIVPGRIEDEDRPEKQRPEDRAELDPRELGCAGDVDGTEE